MNARSSAGSKSRRDMHEFLEILPLISKHPGRRIWRQREPRFKLAVPTRPTMENI
jgi:hypothetical protein